MSFATFETGSDSDDADWAESDDETNKLEKQRREQFENEEKSKPCGFDCLLKLVKELENNNVVFKIFGGAAYVHHYPDCEQKSHENLPFSGCRTHDLDMYVSNDEENKKKFEETLQTWKHNYTFPNIQSETEKEFEGHNMVQLKWTIDQVDHGIDVHWVQDIPEKNIKGSYVSKEKICADLERMVKNNEASEFDGESKAFRRHNRYVTLCAS